MTTVAALKKVFDEMPVGTQFHGNELKQKIVELRPECRNTYIDTILRKLRKLYHGKYKVVGPYSKSLYEKIG